MAVIVVPKFTRDQIRTMLAERRKRIDKAVLTMLQRVGENFVRNARENANYKDRTGNLRSSKGYVILHNGEQIYQNFGGAKKEGIDKAKEVAEESKRKFNSGYVLICVAGMEYAAAVESKGYDVISASSIIAEQDLKNAILQLKNKIKNTP